MSTKVLVVFKPGPIDKMSTAPILTMSILNEEKIETTSSLAKADDIIDSKADDIIDSKADVDAKIDAKNSDQKDHKREESPISHDVINGDVNREMIDPSEDRKERSMQSDSFVVKRGFDCEIDTDCVLHSENARCHKNQCECLSGELMTRYTRCSRVKKAAKSLGEKLSQNGPFIIGMVIMTFFTVFGISLVISQVLKKRIVSIDNPVVTSVNAKDRTTLAPGKTKTIPSAVNIRTK
ncbi:uncharacterized protein LOC135925187 [Gordionus sp. m RMFG-2023]|uniref:uncharacterized protein LOC135925187 n=1 Tax=Gordionus sp. m RMFG-2023 TaxID=3053472 RepID=UPI0031FD29DC